jgi:hypothetical protein
MLNLEVSFLCSFSISVSDERERKGIKNELQNKLVNFIFFWRDPDFFQKLTEKFEGFLSMKNGLYFSDSINF